jgi:hypothetical protein
MVCNMVTWFVIRLYTFGNFSHYKFVTGYTIKIILLSLEFLECTPMFILCNWSLIACDQAGVAKNKDIFMFVACQKILVEANMH